MAITGEFMQFARIFTVTAAAVLFNIRPVAPLLKPIASPATKIILIVPW
jgi:hypothetical protein